MRATSGTVTRVISQSNVEVSCISLLVIEISLVVRVVLKLVPKNSVSRYKKLRVTVARSVHRKFCIRMLNMRKDDGNVTIVLFVFFIFFYVGHAKSCRYWCRAHDHRYYCCPSGKSESWHGMSWPTFSIPWFLLNFGESHWQPFLHSPWEKKKARKHCPPLRSHCPRSHDWYDMPTFCDDDDDCHSSDKCCYDVCLEHKTCKPAE